MDNFCFTKYWCQKVLPLVYDESLSYYEVLCKLCDEMKTLMTKMDNLSEEVEQLKTVVDQLQKWINDFDTSFVQQLVFDYLTKTIKQVVFGLSNTGYFVAYVPSSWDEITFDTIQEGDLYGHLTLNY